LLRQLKALPLILQGTERRFASIYERRAWQGAESLSGPGSSLRATAGIRGELPRLLRELGCRALLDVPCGDFHWMQEVPLELDEYIGADIVRTLVDRNQSAHGKPGRRFEHLDMRRDPLPHVDVILCRDGLVHLSDRDVHATLAHFGQSGARFLLTTDFPAQKRNLRIATGQWRPLNLERPPFGLPPPQALFPDWTIENGPYNDKALALWPIEDLIGR
jgi:hypothetical protein